MLRKLLRRSRTQDRDTTQTPIYTNEQIGPKRAMTPDGFLLCEDVPISRTGTMQYARGEVPVAPSKYGTIHVMRTASELFSPVTIASFNGKPVVDEHPQGGQFVTPETWNRLSIGVVLNPRQGTGDDSEVLLADLLITNKAAIRDVMAGKREVSAGYEANYRDLGEGQGEQSSIIGNHVALVERGRCGPRCAIGDHEPQENEDMPTLITPAKKTVTIPRRQVTPVAAAVRKAFRDAENAMLEELGEDPAPEEEGTEQRSGDTHIHVYGTGGPATDSEDPGAAPAATGGTDPAGLAQDADPANAGAEDPYEARFQALETGHKEILGAIATLAAKVSGGAAPTGDEDPEKKDEEDPAKKMTGDSAALLTGFQALMADAEILAPGFKMPTFDAAATRQVTVDSMCALRRGALEQFSKTADGAALLPTLVEGALDLAKATCQEAANLFKVAVATKKATNNGAMTHDAARVPTHTQQPAAKLPPTAADLNKANREFWAKRT